MSPRPSPSRVLGRSPRSGHAVATAIAACFAAVPLGAQTVLPPFNAAYHVRDLGSIASPVTSGGIAFLHNNPNVLLFGGYDSRQILAVPVVRDGNGKIRTFGHAMTHATVTGPDGGLAYGPNNVLFHTAWPQNIVGQLLPGSTSANRVIQLGPLGVPASVGSCAFPPTGAPGNGRLKLVTYSTSSSSRWCDATIAPDGAGTFSITSVSAPIALGGGTEGILYPPPGAPMFPPNQSVLIAEWDAGRIVLYNVDANGDPVPGTAQPVVAGLLHPSGGAVDPVTGDMLFTHGSGDLVALRVGPTCGSYSLYGQGGIGLFGVPTIGMSGCARLGGQFSVDIGLGRPDAFGILAVGFQQTNVPLFNLFVLNEAMFTFSHRLGAGGRFQFPVAVPGAASIGNMFIMFQALYLDLSAPHGISATPGMRVHID